MYGCTHSLGDWLFFFFNDTATTEIYTLSLHDALPIYAASAYRRQIAASPDCRPWRRPCHNNHLRSEEHTSELQSQSNLVCRLLLEKKKSFATRLQSVITSRRCLSIDSDSFLVSAVTAF